MKEELLTHLNDLLGFVKSSANFVIDQAPLYVQEMLTYAKIEALVIIIVSSIAFLISLAVTIYTYIKRSDDDFWAPIGLVAFAVMTASLILIGANTTTYLKIKYSPRVYVVNHLLNR